jgi:hypothetical protein
MADSCGIGGEKSECCYCRDEEIRVCDCGCDVLAINIVKIVYGMKQVNIDERITLRISKRATPRNGMTKPGNFDPAICTLKLSGQILIGLAHTWSASTRLLGHGKVTTGWLWHDQALIRLTAF